MVLRRPALLQQKQHKKCAVAIRKGESAIKLTRLKKPKDIKYLSNFQRLISTHEAHSYRKAEASVQNDEDKAKESSSVGFAEDFEYELWNIAYIVDTRDVLEETFLLCQT